MSAGASAGGLKGGRTVNLGAGSEITGVSAGATFLDLDNTIIGEGIIGGGEIVLTVGVKAVIEASGGLTFNPDGSITNFGLIEASGQGAALTVDAAINNQIGAKVAAAAGGTVDLAGVNIIGGLVSVAAGSALIAGGPTLSVIKGATVNNFGLIEAESGGLTVTGAVTNAGTMLAQGGEMSITRAETGGTADIADGTLYVGGVMKAVVNFETAPGRLILGDSAAFSGKISGLAVQDSLDLRDIKFASGTTTETFVENAGGTSGVLTVTDGTHTATLNLTGSYVTADFHVLSDGATGGTLVKDVAATAAPAAASVSAFVSAMATFGASSDGALTTNVSTAATPSLLATPHA